MAPSGNEALSRGRSHLPNFCFESAQPPSARTIPKLAQTLDHEKARGDERDAAVAMRMLDSQAVGVLNFVFSLNPP